VGAFAHSSGLEWAVEAGFVNDRLSTQAWIVDWIEQGGGWTDAALFGLAYRAAARRDRERVLELAELALALQTTAERRIETTAQGGAFRRIGRAVAATPALDLLDGIADEDLPYPVAAACLMAGHAAPLDWALTAYLHALVANLSSAAQRLVPLGQTDGQLVIAALREQVAAATQRALNLGKEGEPFEALEQAAVMADIASMAHETQYTRLFRT
jgi:urease accessory protein